MFEAVAKANTAVVSDSCYAYMIAYCKMHSVEQILLLSILVQAY